MKEVCKICYNCSDHKLHPTLTFKPKLSDGKDDSECAVCHQKWETIKVAKELNSSKLVRIRPRPPLPTHVDYRMCKVKSQTNSCQRGLECTFAHSITELWVWNTEKLNEPRPAPQLPGAFPYKICKMKSKSGSCPYGRKCRYAHSLEELDIWSKEQESQLVTKVSHLYVAEAASNSKFSKVSLIECTSKRQLDGHSKSSHVFIDEIVVVDSIFVVNGIFCCIADKEDL